MATTPLNIQKTRYADFAQDFAPHPVTRDFALVKDEESIKQSLRFLFLLKPWERLFQSDVKSPLYDYLFELATPITANLIHDAIAELIEHHEPRIDPIKINVKDDIEKNGYKIDLVYRIFDSTETKTFNFFLERLN